MGLLLRDLSDADFTILFAHQQDATAARMAAFGTRDRDEAAFVARWKKNLAAQTTAKGIVIEGELVGFVATFLHDGKPQVTYWIARSHWGRGVASAALTELLAIVPTRPLYASAAKDNAASVRVLAKCGFRVCGSERAFAEARGEDVEEILFELT